MRAALILVSLMLAGCQREPSFEERYAKTQQSLEQKAAAIDREVATPSPAPTSTAR